jgi:hypothetical protein
MFQEGMGQVCTQSVWPLPPLALKLFLWLTAAITSQMPSFGIFRGPFAIFNHISAFMGFNAKNRKSELRPHEIMATNGSTKG